MLFILKTEWAGPLNIDIFSLGTQPKLGGVEKIQGVPKKSGALLKRFHS